MGGQGPPVLVAGPGARAWVQVLAEAGLDAYGVDPHLAEFADAGPVRAGTLAGHLPSVAPGGLSTTIVVGPQPAADLPALHAVVSGLADRTASVVVVSEAPWWWRRRLGAPAADLSAWRPVSPETWLSLLAGAGYTARAEYGVLGRDYLVTAARVDAPAAVAAAPGPPGSAG